MRVYFQVASHPSMHNAQADGATPLYGASWNGRVEVLQILLHAGGDVNNAMVSCER